MISIYKRVIKANYGLRGGGRPIIVALLLLAACSSEQSSSSSNDTSTSSPVTQGSKASPVVINYPGDFLFTGSVDYTSPNGPISYYKVVGLPPSERFKLVFDNLGEDTHVLSFTNPDFTNGFYCTSFVNGPTCYPTANSSGELYLTVSPGTSAFVSAFFTFDMSGTLHEGTRAVPMDLVYGTDFPHTTVLPDYFTSYYKITGLTVGNSYTLNTTESAMYLYADTFNTQICSSTSSSPCTFTATNGAVWARLYTGELGGSHTIDLLDNGVGTTYTSEGSIGGEVILTLDTQYSGMVDSGVSYYQIMGLTSGSRYQVSLKNIVADNVDLHVYTDSGYTTQTCFSAAAGTNNDVCASDALAGTDLWIKVDGSNANQLQGATYDLIVEPYYPGEGTGLSPVDLTYTGGTLTHTGTVDTISYYLVSGLAPNTSYVVDATGYLAGSNFSFDTAKSFSHMSGCYSNSFAATPEVKSCIQSTDDNGTIAIEVREGTSNQGTPFTLDLNLSNLQSEGTKTAPAAISLGTTALPYPGVVGGDRSFYEISGLTAGSTYDVSIIATSAPADYSYYVYNNVSNLGEFQTGVACSGWDNSTGCTLSVSGTSVWVMVTRGTRFHGSTFDINVAASAFSNEGTDTAPLQLAYSIDLPHNGQVGVTKSNYEITGLSAGTTYVLTFTGVTTPSDSSVILYNTLADMSNMDRWWNYITGFTLYDGVDKIHKITPEGSSLFLEIDGTQTAGPAGASYTLNMDVAPPKETSKNLVFDTDISSSINYSGSTDQTESTYTITGLEPRKLYNVGMSGMVLDFDMTVDGYYSESCQSNAAGTANEECLVASTNAGEITITVHGGKTFYGGYFTLTMAPGLLNEGSSALPMPLDSTTALPYSGQVGTSVTASYYKVSGLTPSTLYTVSVTAMSDNVDLQTSSSSTYSFFHCDSRNILLSDEVCGGMTDANGDLYIVVSSEALDGATFTLNIGAAPQSEGATGAPVILSSTVTIPLVAPGTVGWSDSFYSAAVNGNTSYFVGINNLTYDTDFFVADSDTFGNGFFCILTENACTFTSPGGTKDIFVKVYALTGGRPGTTFDLHVRPAPVQEGATTPVAVALGALPRMSQVVSTTAPSRYQITGLTEGSTHTLALTQLFRNVDLRVYPTEVDMNAGTGALCTSANTGLIEESCTATVGAGQTSLWVEVSGDGTYFTLAVP